MDNTKLINLSLDLVNRLENAEEEIIHERSGSIDKDIIDLRNEMDQLRKEITELGHE